MTKLEEVARAIAIEWMRDKGGGFPSIVTEEAHRLSRAAIQALREPSEEMIKLGADAGEM